VWVARGECVRGRGGGHLPNEHSSISVRSYLFSSTVINFQERKVIFVSSEFKHEERVTWIKSRLGNSSSFCRIPFINQE
jgi:hypothetical protein